MKALIPAAGLGTRWHPWSRIIPKELVPTGRCPAIHHVLDEVCAAGISEIGIILSRSKKILADYLHTVWNPGQPDITLKLFYQAVPRGVADALLSARRWVRDEAVAVLYPDEIHPGSGGLQMLVQAWRQCPGTWIGLTEVKQAQRRQSSLAVAQVDRSVYEVKGFVSDRAAHSQILYGTARYILGEGLGYFHKYLIRVERKKTQELDDDQLFEPLWSRGVSGLLLPGPIDDVGTPENWLKALRTRDDIGHSLMNGGA